METEQLYTLTPHGFEKWVPTSPRPEKLYKIVKEGQFNWYRPA